MFITQREISLIIFIPVMTLKATSATRNPTKFNPQLYDDKCVSEICECGGHKCPPPGPVLEQPLQAQTTFKKCKCSCKKTTKKNCCCKCKHKAKRQPYQQRHYDPGAIQTTYQLQYQGKYVEQEPLRRTAGNGETGFLKHGSNAPFIGNTEYNTQFVGKIVERDFALTKSHPNILASHPRPPFDGTTTYNASFKGKYVEREGPLPQQKVAPRSYVPFDGATEYNTKYQYVGIQGGECESCCECVSDQCSSCCDCQSVDSLDNIAINPKRVTVVSVPQHVPVQDTRHTNTQCPVEVLPPVPRKCSPGKTHAKFSSKKNIWR